MSEKAIFPADARSTHLNIGAEAMFVAPFRGSVFELRSSPLARVGLAYGDLVICKQDKGQMLKFVRRHRTGTFSTVRVVPKLSRWDSQKFMEAMQAVQNSGCGASAHPETGMAAITVPKDIPLTRLVDYLQRDLGSMFVIQVTADRQTGAKPVRKGPQRNRDS